MILVMRSISVLFIDVAGARRRYESEVAFFSIFFSQKKIINRKKIRNLKGTVCPVRFNQFEPNQIIFSSNSVYIGY